jgi:hypothetical protein
MDKISSGQTFFMKRIFPAIWLGFLAVFLVTSAMSGAAKQHAPFLIMPLLMFVFGVVLFRKFVWDLADLVEDHGSYLLVRRSSVEERVALANVVNVSMGYNSRPPRLTLRLRQPGAFGDEIAFIPKSTFNFNPFARNEIAESLIRRVDALRTQGVRS